MRQSGLGGKPIKFSILVSATSAERIQITYDLPLAEIVLPDTVLEQAAKLCMQLGTDGLRAELTLIRAARALASYEQAEAVDVTHLRRVAPPALRHRLRRDPLDESGSTVRVERAVAEVWGAAEVPGA